MITFTIKCWRTAHNSDSVTEWVVDILVTLFQFQAFFLGNPTISVNHPDQVWLKRSIMSPAWQGRVHWRSFCIGSLVPRLFVGGTRGEVGIQVSVSSCTWLGVLIHPVSCSQFCRAIPFFSKGAVLPFYPSYFLGRHILTEFNAVCNATLLFEK